MILPAHLPGEPFDAIFDVGGNVGEWAEQAHERWPDAQLVSFEPLEHLAAVNAQRARGRWTVYPVAISSAPDDLLFRWCLNQHSASTLQELGGVRREHFGIRDRFEEIVVDAFPLDSYLPLVDGRTRLLVKVDVEGHEGEVLRGGLRTFEWATTAIVEVQNDPDIFLGSMPAAEVNERLHLHGLSFAGLAGAFLSPRGGVLQFDGVWTRARTSAVKPH